MAPVRFPATSKVLPSTITYYGHLARPLCQLSVVCPFQSNVLHYMSAHADTSRWKTLEKHRSAALSVPMSMTSTWTSKTKFESQKQHFILRLGTCLRCETLLFSSHRQSFNSKWLNLERQSCVQSAETIKHVVCQSVSKLLMSVFSIWHPSDKNDGTPACFFFFK